MTVSTFASAHPDLSSAPAEMVTHSRATAEHAAVSMCECWVRIKHMSKRLHTCADFDVLYIKPLSDQETFTNQQTHSL